MTTPSQNRAVANHRRRLKQRGLSRYEVRGLDSDKELVRGIAKRLAENDRKADQLRSEMAQKIADEAPKRGGILAALRRSSLRDADLDLGRDVIAGRDIDL